MKKINIVKESRDYTKIIENGFYIKNKYLSIYYMDNDVNRNRYGITVSKKNGNAVVRNKLKRQFKNIIDKHEKLFKNYKDYIIIIRKDVLNLNFQEKENVFIELLKNAKWR